MMTPEQRESYVSMKPGQIPKLSPEDKKRVRDFFVDQITFKKYMHNFVGCLLEEIFYRLFITIIDDAKRMFTSRSKSQLDW